MGGASEVGVDDGSWSLRRDMAVVRLMLRQIPKFFARALQEDPNLVGQPDPSSLTPAVRLVEHDPETGAISKRCIFNNLDALRTGTSFFAVGFFGRQNPFIKKQFEEAGLNKMSSVLDPEGQKPGEVVERIIAVDHILTTNMSTCPKLRDHILCYFSTRVGEVDAHSKRAEAEEDTEDDSLFEFSHPSHLSARTKSSSAPSFSLARDDGEYANLVILRDSDAVELWKSREEHREASVDLSPQYYSSVRIHNLHLHFTLQLDHIHHLLSSPPAKPLVRIYYPTHHSLEKPSPSAIMYRATNPMTNTHLQLSEPSIVDDVIFLATIQTKCFAYDANDKKLAKHGVIVHYQPSSIASRIDPSTPAELSFTTPIKPTLSSTRPLVWTSFLGGNAFKFYSEVTRLAAEKLKHPTAMIECYGLHAALPESSKRWSNPLECFERLKIDLGFLCGVRYVAWSLPAPEATTGSARPLRLVTAPVRADSRYQDRPVYFTDYIVAKDAPYETLDDLLANSQGLRFAFNEEESFSGFLLVLSHLLSLRKDAASLAAASNQSPLALLGFTPVKTGSHGESMRHVAQGLAEASAIDSVVLEMELQQRPELQDKIKVLKGSAGPCSVPPLVASSWVNTEVVSLLSKTLECFGTRGETPGDEHSILKSNGFRRFSSVNDEGYEDLRVILDGLRVTTPAALPAS